MNSVANEPVDEVAPWLAKMDGIAARRDSLLTARNELKSKIEPLMSETRSINAECMPKEARARQLQVDADICRRECDQLRQGFAASGDRSIPGRIATLTSQREQAIAEARSLSTAAERVKYRELMKQIEGYEKDGLRIQNEADVLRAELVRHMNPFTEISEPLEKAGLEYFTRPVVGNDPIIKAWNEFGMACILLRKGDDEAAAVRIGTALELEPHEATFRAVLGYRQLLLGREAEASKELVEALKENPTNSTVHYLMALCQLRKGMFSSAEQHLRRCRELDRTNLRPTILLSLLKSSSPEERVRNPKYARQFAEEALKAEDSPAAHFAMAAALAEAGEFADAKSHATAAQKLPMNGKVGDFHRRGVDTLAAAKVLRIDWDKFDAWNQL